MKKILNILAPFLVVGAIFIGSQMWMKNYDLRYTKTSSQITTIKAIVKKPAGTYPMTRVVGGVARKISVHKPAHRVVKVEIGGEIYEIEKFSPHSKLKVGDSIKVCYNKPAYFGAIFGLRIVGKNMGCAL